MVVKTGFPGRASSRACGVMEHWTCSKRQRLSAVMCSVPGNLINTVAYAWAGIEIYRATWHEYCLLHTGSSVCFVTLSSTLLLSYMEAITLFIVAITNWGPRNVFVLASNIQSRDRPKFDFHRNKFTARFLIILNQGVQLDRIYAQVETRGIPHQRLCDLLFEMVAT